MFNKEIAPLKVGLPPWVGKDPLVLVLGTLPSDESIKTGVYYQNPSNRFWNIMYNLFEGNPDGDRKAFITSHRIALWDCFRSAKRKGSLDKKIEKGTEMPNDIIGFLQEHPSIKSIVLNGKSTTFRAFKKNWSNLCRNSNYIIIPLYQTSQATFGITFEQKLQEWEIVKQIIEKQL